MSKERSKDTHRTRKTKDKHAHAAAILAPQLAVSMTHKQQRTGGAWLRTARSHLSKTGVLHFNIYVYNIQYYYIHVYMYSTYI